jgi:rubrerythrin
MTISFNADEVFEMGMDIEQNGEAYYRKAAELAKSDGIRSLLLRLMEEEKKHFATFKRLREALPPKSSLPTIGDPEGQESLYLDALVKSRIFNNVREAEEAASKPGDEIDVLKTALAFEKDTILFFQSMKVMTKEELGRSEIDKLIEEEHKHVVWISEEIKKARK